jgi:hypothetical protein
MIGRCNGENSVVLRHEAEERRRDRLEAQEIAEARDREAIEDDGPIPPKTAAHMEAVKRIQEGDQCPRK